MTLYAQTIHIFVSVVQERSGLLFLTHIQAQQCAHTAETLSIIISTVQ